MTHVILNSSLAQLIKKPNILFDILCFTITCFEYQEAQNPSVSMLGQHMLKKEDAINPEQ